MSDAERHVLIDFGSTGVPKGTAQVKRMTDIAKGIEKRTGGKLDAVVATHRHKDHISGIATDKGKGTGDVIRRLKPKVVVQPWTEAPDLATNATEPKLKRLGKTTPLQIAALASMHQAAQIVAKRAQYFDKEVGQELSFMGENNLANLSAVKNLMAMGKNTRMCLLGPNRVSKACCLESTLVAALKRESELFSTEALEGEDFFHDTMIKF